MAPAISRPHCQEAVPESVGIDLTRCKTALLPLSRVCTQPLVLPNKGAEAVYKNMQQEKIQMAEGG